MSAASRACATATGADGLGARLPGSGAMTLQDDADSAGLQRVGRLATQYAHALIATRGAPLLVTRP